MDEGIQVLTKMFEGRAWFYDVGIDQYGRYVVYTNFMCDETLHNVPDRIGGKQVLVHFAASKLARADQFTNTTAPAPKLELVVEPDDPLADVEELPSSFLEVDFSDLCKEIDRLERMCGSNCLQDIFYEVHDGKNAVTNLSAKYPEVRASMEKLYEDYGFDVIYEELDG